MNPRHPSRAVRGRPRFDGLETRAMMTHVSTALVVEAYLARNPQAEIQQATPAATATAGTGTNSTGGGNDLGPNAGGFPPVSNTYSKFDRYSNYIGGSVGLRAFVDGLYMDVLHRRGTPRETSFWTGTLESGRSTPYTVVSYLLQSGEAIQAGGSGQRLLPSHPPANVYTGYLGGDVGVKAFVDGLYYDVLQRAPDPPGEAYWIGQIENDDLLPAKITFSFLASAEYEHALG
jgi:hypothetical protein